MSDKPIRRWTSKELEAKRIAFESLPSERWSPEDHYAALEYVFQRYYPQTEPLLQSRWDSTMVALRAKVDQNLKLAKQGKRPPSSIVETNSLIAHHHALLHDSYDMPLQDFEQIVVPALARFPFAEGFQLNHQDLLSLHTASGAGPGNRAAKDRLIGHFHDAFLDAARALRSNYEILRRAQNAGCTSATLIVPARCGCLHDLLDARLVSITEVLQSFELGTPLYPPHRTPCTIQESPSICSLTLLPKSPLIRRPGDDEDFAEFLEHQLFKDTPSPALNWQQILEERTRAAEREQ